GRHIALAAISLAVAACADVGPPGGGGDATNVTSTPIPAVSFDAVYVVNGESSSITVIDAESNTVAGTIALEGVRYPYTVSVSPDRALLALAVPGFAMSSGQLGHAGHAASTRGYVVLIDALTGERRMATRLSAANPNVAFLPGTGHEV